MEQIEKTRRIYLHQARKEEERAMALENGREQDAALDTAVLLRILASLPKFNKARVPQQ